MSLLVKKALDKLENNESLDFPPPEEWFLKSFVGLDGQRKWNRIELCSPRAIYRLADCYGMND